MDSKGVCNSSHRYQKVRHRDLEVMVLGRGPSRAVRVLETEFLTVTPNQVES